MSQHQKSSFNRYSHSYDKSFYTHKQPWHLNYYSRYSPKRIKGQFQKYISLNGSLISTSRSLEQKQTLKRSRNHSQQKEYSAQQRLDNKRNQLNGFKLINQNLILPSEPDRGQIFIDDSQQRIQGFDYSKKGKIKEVEEINRQRSSDSSSFQRMIEKSGSDSIPIESEPKGKSSSEQFEYQSPKKADHTNNQILIFDAEQQDQQNIDEQAKRFLPISFNKKQISPNGKFISEDQNYLKGPQTDRTHKNQQRQQNIRQIKSANQSFSLEGDLSIIEQKWNSYFQEDDSVKSMSAKLPNQDMEIVYNQNMLSLQQLKNKQSQYSQYLNNYPQQTQEGLPSFSTPNNTSAEQNQSYSPPNLNEIGKNFKQKQLNRHFTFGNELNTIQAAMHKQQPLFKKLLSNQTLQNVSKKKRQKIKVNKLKNSRNKVDNKLKIQAFTQKSFIIQNSALKKEKNRTQSSKNNSIIKQSEENIAFRKIENPPIANKTFSQSQKMSSSITMSRFAKKNSQQQYQVNTDHTSIKKMEKAKKRQIWQNTIKAMIQKQKSESQKRSRQSEQQMRYLQSSRMSQQSHVQSQKQKSLNCSSARQQTESADSYSQKFKQAGRTRKGSYQSKGHQSNQNNTQKLSTYQSSSEQHYPNTQRSAIKTEQNQSQYDYTSRSTDNTENSKAVQEQINFTSHLTFKKKTQTPEIKIQQNLYEEQQDDKAQRYLYVQQQEQVSDVNNNCRKTSDHIFIFNEPNNEPFLQRREQEIKNQNKNTQIPQQNSYFHVQKQSLIQKNGLLNSLNLLEQTIPLLPQQLTSIYSKLYEGLFKKSIQYQIKFEKQHFLLDMLKMLMYFNKKSLDCQQFIIEEEQQRAQEYLQNEKSMDVSQRQSDLKSQERQQIAINRHLILGLVRQIAAKQDLIKSK